MKILIHSSADISEVFLNAVNSVSKYKECSVVGIYSRDINKANKYRDKHNLLYAYDNFTKSLESNDFDTVYISAPNSLHYEIAMQAISAKKNVIVEKPIALEIEQISKLYEHAKENGVYVFDAVLTLYTSAIKEIKEFIKDEEVILIDFHLSKQTRHYTSYRDGKYFNVFDKKMGGGSINDLGVYLIYPLLYLFGYEYDLNASLIKNDLEADIAAVVSGSIGDSLFSLRTSKLVSDKRSSIICTTNHTIEIDNINLFTNVYFYNIQNELVKEIKNSGVKMADEVSYFCDVVNGDIEFDDSIITLGTNVREFIKKVGI